ncbi:hypothetical protein [Streptomyces sp. NPDC058401]|uniref:hypothetical protein n=1 Tax=Streptomyces sp. NPDC058401 TaxID=3346480 RepID=UPI00364B0A7C
MPDPSPGPAFTMGGVSHPLTRQAVEAAAAGLLPAHSARGLDYVWYALVGRELHYVVALAAAAAGQPLPDRPSRYVKDARLALKALGYPVVCWADSVLLDKGHPSHTG